MRFLTFAIALSILSSAAFAQDKTTGNTAPIAPYTGAQSAEPDIKKANKQVTSYLAKEMESDYVMGKKGAPVTLIEYASLSCPHCAHFSNVVLPDLQKKYIDTGKVRYVLRHFPLNEPALKGAILVECVGQKDKEKYFTFSRVLFNAQKKWAFDGNYMEGLETIANVGGVSKEQFQACMNDTALESKILQQKKLANDELKLPGTPYILVNGEVDDSKHSIEELSALIDAKLEAAGGKK